MGSRVRSHERTKRVKKAKPCIGRGETNGKGDVAEKQTAIERTLLVVVPGNARGFHASCAARGGVRKKLYMTEAAAADKRISSAMRRPFERSKQSCRRFHPVAVTKMIRHDQQL